MPDAASGAAVACGVTTGPPLAGRDVLTLTAYAAEPDSSTAERLALLASWAATRTGEVDERLPH